MNRRFVVFILLSAALLLAACSNQVFTSSPQSTDIVQLPNEDNVYILSSEDELKEKLLQTRSKDIYEIEYYYRPAVNVEHFALKCIQLNQYNVIFTYMNTVKEEDTEYNFVWFFSQSDGDDVLVNSIDRLGYVYVYPDNPVEGVKYVSDMDRDEARKAGRVSWDVDYSINGVLFRANIPWDISDEDVAKYLQMEKVSLK